MSTVFFGTYEGRLLGYSVEKVDDGYAMMLKYAVETHIGCVKAITSINLKGIPYVVTGGVDESIRLFELKQAKEVGTILFHQGDVSALEFAGGENLLSGGSDGKLVVWRTEDWTKLHILGSHKGAVTCVCSHPSNMVALSCGTDHTVRMWNLVKGRLGYVRKVKEQALKIVFNREGNEYAILFAKSVCVYEMKEGEQVFIVNASEGVNDLVFLPVGRNGELVVVGNDKKVRVFDRKGVERRSLDAGTKFRLRTVTTVAIEGRETPLVVTGSSDGCIQLWDVDASEEALLDELKTSERLTCSSGLRMKKN